MVFKNLCICVIWTKIALALEVLNVFLYIFMPDFSCSSVIGSSKDVREDPYDVVKNHDQCFRIFLCGINSVSMDISMHRSKIINIKNKIYTYISNIESRKYSKQ